MRRALHVLVRLVVVVAVLGAVAAGVWYYQSQQEQQDDRLRASGTIEADSVTLGPELPGRVAEVLVEEGQQVSAGESLLRLDGTTLEAQRDQAQASAEAAEAGAAAAQASLRLLEAGASAEQLAVAQGMIDRAQLAADRLEEEFADQTRAQRDTPQGRELRTRRDLARVDVDNAQAQLELTRAGARPEEIDAARAQAEAATAQAAAARAALAAIESQLGSLTVASPVDGVVLSRATEPGEYATPGSALIVVGRLSSLTITVYVPVDRYGPISLGQSAQVSVDSFSTETFSGTVVRIADQAEFTPRNVQTPEGRRSTVFAIRLGIENPDGRLKPGMPADVEF
jgi:HlyD family secretion protein